MLKSQSPESLNPKPNTPSLGDLPNPVLALLVELHLGSQDERLELRVQSTFKSYTGQAGLCR